MKIIINNLKRFLIYLILFYQRYISPLKPPSCRFQPTCSSYALEALEKYGLLKGVFLSIKRFVKCNPFVKGGYDPVEGKKSERK